MVKSHLISGQDVLTALNHPPKVNPVKSQVIINKIKKSNTTNIFKPTRIEESNIYDFIPLAVFFSPLAELMTVNFAL